MRQGIEKKVIRASAGTGKTYRLSLEFIGLLLKYAPAGIDFSEILVITFTRKATAEIRERIFKFLKEIVYDTKGKRAELEENLKLVTGISIDEDARKRLKDVYFRMVTNKNLVQISTIDSFTNQVFKTVIGPYLGIMDYEIVPENDENLLAALYDTILTKENLSKLEQFFFRSGKKKISEFKKFVSSLIDLRWAFELMGERNINSNKTGDEDVVYAQFRRYYDEALDDFHNFLLEKPEKGNKSAKSLLKSSYFEIILNSDSSITGLEIVKFFKEKLNDKDFLLSNYPRFLSDPNNFHFWNGSTIYRGDQFAARLEEQKFRVKLALQYLADWIWLQEGRKEAWEILSIADSLYKKYDEIKFREKKFTYNDISYYTFKYLYEPELSLIENDVITNRFFEYLTGKIRFLLIDEFQDTSIIQYKILYPMMREVISGSGVKDYGGVIVVGDEKQSIYGWRGGERDLLLRMKDALHGAEEHPLKTSYRSERNIIDFINKVFGDEILQEQLRDCEINWPYEIIADNKEHAAGGIKACFANISKSDNDTDSEILKINSLRELFQRELKPRLDSETWLLSKTAILARVNKDLKLAESVLSDLNIPYLSESSFSVFQHPAIVPIFHFLRFCAFRDMYNLLAFLRSDYVLMPANELREFLDAFRSEENKNIAEVLLNSANLPTIANFCDLLKTLGILREKSLIEPSAIGVGLLELVKALLEHYSVLNIFGKEDEIKNIHLFFEVLSLFENNRQTYTHDIQGFLEYCSDLEKNEEFKQVGLETLEAVRLLTIHKAKGLEFDNVILLWNFRSDRRHDGGELKFFPMYNSEYTAYHSYALTFNFEKVLKFSSQNSLVQAKEIRDAIEKINLLYVAMTRAKANSLFLFWFEDKKGLESFLGKIDLSKLNQVDRLIAQAIYRNSSEDSESESWRTIECTRVFGSFIGTEESETLEGGPAPDFGFVGKYMTFDRFKQLAKPADELETKERAELIRRFIKDKSTIKGDVAHYYLSFIRFDNQKSRQMARKRTLMKYGSLLPQDKIEKIIEQVNKFLHENSVYFSRDNWSQVFTELTIFDRGGESESQLRIDRLMVNHEKKLAVILDYKSGEVWREEQIEEYKRVIESLPVVKNGNYRVETKYVKIDLSAAV